MSELAVARSLTILEPFRLGVEHLDQLPARRFRKLQVVPCERGDSPVDRADRCPQLVRHGRDDVATHLLEPSRFRGVPEGVERPVGVGRRDQREPELAAVELEGARRRPALTCGQACRDRIPPRQRLLDRHADDGFRGETGDPRSRRVPEADGPRGVDREDAVRQLHQHALGPGALGSDPLELRQVDAQSRELE
ncbi:MAG TPA: hypothetical protein VFI37_02900, partial [Gaiellaceae bacterium]|nr:hypothetical protein [Gaiellaceae bacterium]